tara:strand:- start:107 stop:424 length:318 start_codon:yes stop_codon:yes gene_type:complete
MPAKVKQIKEDAIVTIEVNKIFYKMVKDLSGFLISGMEIKSASDLQSIMKKDFDKMTDPEKGVYTLTLLLAEIEVQADKQDKIEETEILLPNDPGFEKPDLSNED